jgi:type VI secretion system secreted protein Hcp
MPFDAFMWLENEQNGAPKVEGETNDVDFSAKKAFEITSFSFGASNPSSIGSAGGGSGSGKVNLSSFSISKLTDNASPSLWLACCNGGHYDNGYVTLRRAGGQADKTGSEYIKYEFAEVFVDHIQWSGSSGGDDRPMESVSFSFGAVKLTYTPQESGGEAGTDNEKMWSVVQNNASMDVGS